MPPVGYNTAPVGYNTAPVGYNTTPVGHFSIPQMLRGSSRVRHLGPGGRRRQREPFARRSREQDKYFASCHPHHEKGRLEGLWELSCRVY